MVIYLRGCCVWPKGVEAHVNKALAGSGGLLGYARHVRVGDSGSRCEQGPRGQRRLDGFCLTCESGSRLHVLVDLVGVLTVC